MHHTHKKSPIFSGFTQINFSCQQHVNAGWQSNCALHSYLGTQADEVLFQHMWSKAQQQEILQAAGWLLKPYLEMDTYHSILHCTHHTVKSNFKKLESMNLPYFTGLAGIRSRTRNPRRETVKFV